MKLLITTADFSRWHSRAFHYLLIELAKITELTVCYEAGDIRKIIEDLNIEPDFVFVNEFGESNAPKITGLASLGIPWGIYMFDLHYKIENRKEVIDKENVKHIFTHCRDKFYEFFPEYWEMMRWLPLHVNTEIFKDYGLPRDIDYLLMGVVHKRIYPLRYQVSQVMQGVPGFVWHEHVGHRNFDDDEDALVGERYAREISRAKIFFTCDSKYKYPVGKFFEVPACNTLLLASTSRELRDLGFIPGSNYIAVHEKDIKEKAQYYLHHEEERLEIARRGYEMVREQHSTSRRAAELVAMIEDIIASYQT